MKLKIAAVVALMGVAASCMTQKKAKVEPVFPAEMNESVKVGYLEMWKKGQILYDINCSRCHNRVEKRKVIIPEFTDEQLASYEIRITDPNHEMFVSETKVTPEELNLITIFLQYRVHDSVELKRILTAPRDHSHDS